MSNNNLPDLISAEALRDAINGLDPDAQGLTVQTATALAGVDNSGSAATSAHLTSILIGSAGDPINLPKIVSMAVGFGIAIGAIAARNTDTGEAAS